MRKLITFCCPVVIVFHVALANATDHSAAMLGMAEKIIGRAEKFADMAESLSGIDQDVASELQTVAMNSSDKISYISDLLGLQFVMLNKLDKLAVQRVLDAHKKVFSKECARIPKHITRQIAYTSSPAVASEGERLRDDVVSACNRVLSLK